jgi:TatD DNase family protein
MSSNSTAPKPDDGTTTRNEKPSRRYVDIGANLTDGMFKGEYHGKKYHAEDLHRVLCRARDTGVETILVTAGTLEEAVEAVTLAERFDPETVDGKEKDDETMKEDDRMHRDERRDRVPRLRTTVGVHPTRCDAFENSGDPEKYFRGLMEHAREYSAKKAAGGGRVVAVGECGLDYDRLQFCAKDVQKKWFVRHFEISRATGLPVFLHSRNAHEDFLQILKTRREVCESRGEPPTPWVVHSFDGGEDELADLLALGKHVYIGINGCSLRTEASLEVVQKIPLNRLMVETDAPWCSVKKSHPGEKFVTSRWEARDKKKERRNAERVGDAFATCAVETRAEPIEPSAAVLATGTIKDRCEPCHVAQVVEILAAVRNQSPEEIAEASFRNAGRVFFPDETDDDA